MISSGLTKQRANAYRITATDDLGHGVQTYTGIGSLRCDLRDVGADERAYAQGVAIVRNFLVVCRWQDVQRLALTERDRLTVRGHVLRINAIRNVDERDRRAEIDCTEVG